MSDDDSTSILADLERDVQKAMERNPALAKLYREKRATLAVSAALREICAYRNVTIDELAKRANMSLEDIDRIYHGASDSPPSIALLATIAAAIDYKFEFRFLPKEYLEGQLATQKVSSEFMNLRAMAAYNTTPYLKV